MSNDLTIDWRTNDEQITVDRLNAEIERLKTSNARGQEYSQQLFDENERLKLGLNKDPKKTTEWVINGIKVTVERDPAASDDETEFTYKVVSYVFRMDGLRAKILPGFDALETMVWLNKLEREQ